MRAPFSLWLILRALAFLIFVGLVASPLSAQISVDASASDGGDGADWTRAFDNLQVALLVAGDTAPNADGSHPTPDGKGGGLRFEQRSQPIIANGFFAGNWAVTGGSPGEIAPILHGLKGGTTVLFGPFLGKSWCMRSLGILRGRR